MDRLMFFGNSEFDGQRVRQHLAGVFEVACYSLAQIEHHKPGYHTVIAANLGDVSFLPRLKEWINAKPKGAKIVFVTREASRIEEVRAFGLGATDVIHRPFTTRSLLRL